MGGTLDDAVRCNFSPCRTRPLREVVDKPTIHRRHRRRCCWVSDDLPLEPALANDDDAFAADLAELPLPLLPLIRRLFDESGGEGVTFLLPALPPADEAGFDDPNADADADAEDATDDV